MTATVGSRKPRKGYKGMGMEGSVARWYARSTGNVIEQFRDEARRLAMQIGEGGSILEVAPGPGYLAIELARIGGFKVVGLDISKTFVELATENAKKAGARVEFHHGNASAMPFDRGSFDLIVCRAAFKNFSEPIRAINEMHRVLKPGGKAVIVDLRKDASAREIDAAVDEMKLDRINSAVTKWIFKHFLLKRANSQDDFRRMAAQSMAGKCEISVEDISLIVTLRK